MIIVLNIKGNATHVSYACTFIWLPYILQWNLAKSDTLYIKISSILYTACGPKSNYFYISNPVRLETPLNKHFLVLRESSLKGFHCTL